MNNEYSKFETELNNDKVVIAITHGDSMEPLLYDNSTRVVIVKPKNKLKRNDLPLYKRDNGQYVMHRIIKTKDNYSYTRGDNRSGLEKIPNEWIIGVVTEIYRKDKHFNTDNKKYKAYIIIWNLIYPFRWIIYKFRSLIKRIKRRKNEKRK